MKDKKLQALLNQNMPMVDETKRKQTIEIARQIIHERHFNIIKKSLFQRIVEQIGFISHTMWIVQLCSISFLCWIIISLSNKDTQINSILAMITCLVPLVALIGMPELCRSFKYGMWEIEQSCVYNLRQLLSMKLIIIGFADLLIASMLIGLFGLEQDGGYLTLSVYILVPFIISNMCYLLVFNFMRQRNSNYILTTIGIALGCVFLRITTYPRVYESNVLWLWIILLIVALAVLAGTIYKLLIGIEKGDGLNWSLQ